MSFLTSTALARPQYVLAIAGITGKLGQAIAPVFLSSFKPYFSTIRGLVRDPSSVTSQSLAAAGIEIYPISEDDPGESVYEALQGVDIVINVLGVTAAALKNVVAEAAVKAGVGAYFLSEFGVDHRLNDFPGYDHSDWIHKREGECIARQLAGDNMKVISVYTSLFLEDVIGPVFNSESAIGSPTQRITFTSKGDIGRAIAELSLLALSPSSATVPDHVRIAGCTVTYEDVKRIVERVRKEVGVQDGDGEENVIRSENLEEFREKVKTKHLDGEALVPIGHLRILMAENKLDFSADNCNELVNPHESIWKWKTVEEYIREVGGQFP